MQCIKISTQIYYCNIILRHIQNYIKFLQSLIN